MSRSDRPQRARRFTTFLASLGCVVGALDLLALFTFHYVDAGFVVALVLQGAALLQVVPVLGWPFVHWLRRRGPEARSPVLWWLWLVLAIPCLLLGLMALLVRF